MGARWLIVAIAVGLGTATVIVPAVRASCMYTKPIDVAFAIDTCKPVEVSKIGVKYRKRYAGVVVTGKDAAKKLDVNAWVPEAAKLDCKTLKPGVEITATLGYACCDGDPNPPCWAGLAQYLIDVKIKKP